MGNGIAIIGAGRGRRLCRRAYGQAGEDVTFVDFWPENVEAMRATGLRISHLRGRAGIHRARCGPCI